MDSSLKPSHVVAVFPFAVDAQATWRQVDLCRGIALYFQRRLSRIPGIDARIQVLSTEDGNDDGRGWVLSEAPFTVEQAQIYPFPRGFEPTHLLHGSFRRDRAVAHTEVVLIDMQSGIELLHDRGTGPIDEVYPRLAGLVGNVAAELSGSTSTGRLAARSSTKSTEAFERQILGLAGLQSWSRGIAGPEAAFQYFNGALELDPHFTDAADELELLAEICIRAGDRDGKAAVSALEKAHQTVPGHVGFSSLLGFHLVASDHPEKGTTLLREVIERDPHSAYGAKAFRTLADNAIKRGDTDDARRLLLQGARANPEDSAIWERLGNLHAEQGSAQRAEAAWLRALQEDPDRPETLARLGAAWSAKGRHSDAIPLLHRAQRLSPFGTDAVRHLGRSLIETGAIDEADEVVTSLVEDQPTSFEGWLLLAEIRRLLQQPDVARHCVAQAKLHSGGAGDDARVAVEEFALSAPAEFAEWRLLEEESRRLTDSSKPSVVLFVRRAKALLERNSNLPPRFRTLAVRLFATGGDFPEAARQQKLLLGSAFGSLADWDYFASLCLKAEDPANAEMALLHGIDIEPRVVERHIRLARLLKEMDRGGEALEILAKALEIDPGRVEIRRLQVQWRRDEVAPRSINEPIAEHQSPEPGVLRRIFKGLRLGE